MGYNAELNFKAVLAANSLPVLANGKTGPIQAPAMGSIYRTMSGSFYLFN
jgi:hypothetical protein